MAFVHLQMLSAGVKTIFYTVTVDKFYVESPSLSGELVERLVALIVPISPFPTKDLCFFRNHVFVERHDLRSFKG